LEGKYVIVQMTGTIVINLAEIEVFGVPTSNIEINPVAVEMSSVWTGNHQGMTSLPGRLCIDNNRETICHTRAGETWPWVAVEIPPSRVQQVIIVNRPDCCGDRTNNVKVWVGDSLPTTTDAEYSQGRLLGEFNRPGSNGQVIPFQNSEGLEGKYVIVQMTGTIVINLAEIEVFGVPTSNIGGCQHRRVRKNVNSLTSTEVNNLQNAMRRALESSIPWRRYQDVAHFHWSPNTGSDALCGEGIGCCPHSDRRFLPWHRLLMANMEELLGEPLPYWDWTLDGNVPNIFDNIQVPFKRTVSVGSQCQGTNTGRIRRGININIPSFDLFVDVQTAFEAVDFETFSSLIEGPHNTLHVRMRCDMFAVETAAYDPIFYLHHTNVDRQFAFWQELQRIRNRDIEHSDLSIPLQPFNRETNNPFEKTRNNNLGANTLDYKTNLCYDYDTLTFNGMTPQQFNTRNARRIFRYFVGIVLPKLGPSTAVKFSVCSRRGRCKAAGRVFTFGLGGKKRTESKKTVNSENYYIAEKEVTHISVKNWKSSYARVRSSPDISPVAPVIIKRTIQDHLSGGVVFYAPGTNTTMYGDLLEKFKDSV